MKSQPKQAPVNSNHQAPVSIPKQQLDLQNSPIEDHRAETGMQFKLQETANNSTKFKQFKSLQGMADSYTHSQNPLLQKPINVAPTAQLKEKSVDASQEAVQRKVIVDPGAINTVAFQKAFKIFMSALQSQGGEIGAYLHFVNDPKNHHDLIFKTKRPPKSAKGQLHGVTNVVFKGTSEDILDHMFVRNLDPNERIDEIMSEIDPIRVMRGVDVLIEIMVTPEMTEPILLETLNHEFTVHAIRWHKFIRTTFAKDRPKAMQALRERIGTMRSDHDDFGSDKNELYANVRRTIMQAIHTEREPRLGGFGLPQTQEDELMQISRDAIYQHRPAEVVRKEFDDLVAKTENLGMDTPLIRFKKKKPPKKNKCCYITTACTVANGLPDDCEELTVLRDFRDTYLLQKPNGKRLIEIYYEHSPYIVHCIRQCEDEEEILRILYGIIKRCVQAIKRGNMEFAYHTYCFMVLKLKELFVPELECEIPEI